MLSAGNKLGPYEIVAPIGAGGMGEVYRARDTRLGRDVAIKVLPASFAGDAEHLRRFEQEARVVAALNHPNILAIHDVGTPEGAPYLVSELLEGATLLERLAEGPLPPRKAVDYALQIAQGLAAAHDRGIVHRDLKPENLFITQDGRLKILDFGLAKLAHPDMDAGKEGATEGTRTTPGMVMGTAGYIAPEQVRATGVDHRSDIFAFGAVLYEMLSGKRAFQGETSVETLNAILKTEPAELRQENLQISPGLERIVEHCLEKKPSDRFQSSHDLTFALRALSGTEITAAVASPAGQRNWIPWAGTAAVVAVAVLALAFPLWKGEPHEGPMRFAIPVPGEISSLALSADGRMLAFVSFQESSGSNLIFVQGVGAGTARALPGTEGATYPAWSPDDAFLAFFADGKLKKIAVMGGEPLVLASANMGRGISWGSKGVILYAPSPAGGGLWQIHADGTGAALEDNSSEFGRWPVFLPDGEHYLFWTGNFDANPDDKVSGIYLSSLGSKDKKLLVLARSNPGYGGGALFYLDARVGLVSVPLDLNRGRLSGEPTILASALAYSPSTYLANFAVASNGTLIYDSSSGVTLLQLTWYDRFGKQLGTVGDAGVVANPAISPDGSRVVEDINDLKARNVDLWIDDLGRGTTSRFTFTPSEDVGGVWSRDGKRIAYRANVRGPNLHIKNANGLLPAREIFGAGHPEGGDRLQPNSWSADDQEILCTQRAASASKLFLVKVASGAMTPFLNANGNQVTGQISSDGKWMAYASDESGEWEIYATTFPGAAGKWQVSRGGGTQPRWRGDGKEIFYLGPRNILTWVPVSTEAGFSTGVPAQLFQLHTRPPVSNTDLYVYDLSKDAKRFLIARYVKPEHVPPLQIVLNSTAPNDK